MLMILPYLACGARRWTVTTTVFCILFEVTIPTRVLGRPREGVSGAEVVCFSSAIVNLACQSVFPGSPRGWRPLGGARLELLVLLLRSGLLLRQDGEDAGQVAAVAGALGRAVQVARAHA